MDTTAPPAIRGIFDAGVTRAELRYLFLGSGMTRREYEVLLAASPGGVDAVGLYQLFKFRGDEAAAARYLAMLDEESQRCLTVPDLLLSDRPGASR